MSVSHGLLRVACLLGEVVVFAQVPTATITGVAQDPSKTVVQGARITVTNTATHYNRSAVTGTNGEYRISGLPVGPYELRAEMQGFKTAAVSNIILEVDQLARVDIGLELGQIAETVQVVGTTAPLVQPEDSQVGTVITNIQIVELPLNGRNFIQLNRLVPGVVPGPHGNFFDNNTAQTDASFSVNGQRIYANQFYIDGANTTQAQSQANSFSPPIDSIQEFKLQTSQYSAELGQGGAGQVNLVTKSGTNRFHGTAYEFVRNDFFDARNYFDPPRAVRKATLGHELPPYRQNQFGGVFGAPAMIPRVYNGKDRTFIFFSYEGLRVSQQQTATALIPTLAQRQGVLTGISGSVHDPLSGQPFPGNIIPPERINPVSRQLLPYYPEPNSSDPTRNYISSSPSYTDSNYVGMRVDHRFSVTDNVMGRYQQQIKDLQPFVLNPNFALFAHNNSYNSMVSETHVFGPGLINEIKLSYNKNTFGQLTGHSYKDNIVEKLAILGLNQNPRDFGVPGISISGYQGLGDSTTYEVPHQIYQVLDDVSWMRGRHALKFGADIQRQYYNFVETLTPNGSFSFNGQFSGNALADFLLGYPASVSRSISQFSPRYRRDWLHFFWQDDWRVSGRLTVNLGLRYEADKRPISLNDTIASFDPGTGQMVLPGQNGYPRSLKEGGLLDFGPRIGFAYRLTNDNKTVLRGGYGIFYQQMPTNEDVDLAINPPFITQNSVVSSISTPTIDFQDPFNVRNGASTSPVLVFGATRQFSDPYIQQWSLDVQRSLPGEILVEAAYLGNKGTRLPMLNWINQATPGPGAVQARRPYPNFGTIYWIGPFAASSYHGLQLKAEKRFSHGLAFLVSYAFSKAVDDSSTAVIGTGDGNANIQNAHNLRAEKALSLFDTRNQFSFNWVYELPFGAGRPVALRGVPNVILGGWEIDGITLLHSGQPLTVALGTTNANVGDGTERPDQLRNPNLPASQQTVNRFFDTSAFAKAAPFTFGNAGRDTVIGPGYADVDFSAVKSFRFTEERRLQFRGEFFNALNHPNFFKPVATFTSPAFGSLTAAAFSRQIQFALKLVF
jgi:hypothetical protein